MLPLPPAASKRGRSERVGGDCPTTVEGALEAITKYGAKMPGSILLMPDGKYIRVAKVFDLAFAAPFKEPSDLYAPKTKPVKVDAQQKLF